MTINTSLYNAANICLRPIDFDKDPEIESRWTHDPAYLRALRQDICMPLSPAAVKKSYEKLEKEMDEKRSLYYFTIRSRSDSQGDERLLGFTRLYGIEWAHGTAALQIAIGSPADRRQGFGSQAMNLILRYAFHETNFFRLTAVVGADNPDAVRFFQRFGFVEEVRRRQALHRDGQYYDLLFLGLLSSEWSPT